MESGGEQGAGEFQVLVNDEGQHALVDRFTLHPAPGWRPAGCAGSREHCLAWIEANWTDMRPTSLRTPPEAGAPGADTPSESGARTDLVTRLTAGEQRVEACLRAGSGAAEMLAELEKGRIRLRFPDTDGGAELWVAGIHLRPASERVSFVGETRLDGVSLRCEASIELDGLTGSARLQRKAS